MSESSRETAERIWNKVKQIEISTRKVVDTMLAGQYHTNFKGHGMQFAEFREYAPGDDIRHIDWKVTARTQLAQIKRFEEERDLTVYILFDVSRSGDFGSAQKSKVEALAEVCAALAFAAVRNNDRVGVILFSDEIEKHVPARKGRVHAMRCLSEILHFQSQRPGTNIKKALEFFNNISKQTTVTILASDFLDSGYENALKRVARKHDLVTIRMRDERETDIPKIGWFEFQDAESGESYWADLSSYAFQNDLKKNQKVFEEQLEANFKKAGIERLDLWTHKDYFRDLVSFFKTRHLK